MPRFPEKVQEKVDEKHKASELAFKQTNALMTVPPDARLAMPPNPNKFFLVKKGFLNSTRVQRISNAYRDGVNVIPDLTMMNAKVKKMFGVKITHWGTPSYRRIGWSEGREGLLAYNSYLKDEDKMPKWQWCYDRQVSAILWLSNYPDFLEFPYLVTPPADIEAKVLKPEAGTLVIFPSHPMYAFRYLPHKKTFLSEKVQFLEYHASVQGAKRPHSSSSS